MTWSHALQVTSSTTAAYVTNRPVGEAPRTPRSSHAEVANPSAYSSHRGANPYCPNHSTGVRLPDDFFVTPLPYADRARLLRDLGPASIGAAHERFVAHGGDLSGIQAHE